MIVNTTNKSVKLKKVCVKLEATNEANMVTIRDSISEINTNLKKTIDQSENNALDEHKTITGISKLLNVKQDIFASNDSELEHTAFVKKKANDTGAHSRKRLWQYSSPLYNIKVVDQAIKEMTDAKIITRYKISLKISSCYC